MPLYPPASSGGGAPSTATYLTQTADGTLSAEQAMGALATGLVKNTTTTGVQSIAVADIDYATALTYTAGGADAAQTMATNTVYYVDISGYTADRTYTLPAVAALGDSVAILITTGDNAFELLVTAAAGDTLNGVAGGTEWSRLFITGESIIMRCVAASAAWIVQVDRRIPYKGVMEITGSPDGETAATYTTPTAASTPGTFTATVDVGDCTTVASSLVTARRAGRCHIALAGQSKDNGTAGNYIGVRALVAGVSVAQQDAAIVATILKGYPTVAKMSFPMAVDDTVTYQYRSQAGALGLVALPICFLSVSEVLP